jgi:hypothetical protein
VSLLGFLLIKLSVFGNYDFAMTFKQLLNFGGFQESQPTPPLEHYHHEYNDHDRGWHGQVAIIDLIIYCKSYPSLTFIFS